MDVNTRLEKKTTEFDALEHQHNILRNHFDAESKRRQWLDGELEGTQHVLSLEIEGRILAETQNEVAEVEKMKMISQAQVAVLGMNEAQRVLRRAMLSRSWFASSLSKSGQCGALRPLFQKWLHWVQRSPMKRLLRLRQEKCCAAGLS